MSSKYLSTLIEIVNHVSATRVNVLHSCSCTLISESYKNLKQQLCIRIDCGNCAFNNSNHKKIDYLITEGNSDG